MLTPTQYARIFRISAWYDLLVTWPYMTPLTLGLTWNALNALHLSIGQEPLPDFTPYAVLFGNFFGTIVIIWSVLRLRLNMAVLARYDAVGRWLFSAWMINALLHGASPLLWGFLVIELTFAMLQSLPVRERQPRVAN